MTVEECRQVRNRAWQPWSVMLTLIRPARQCRFHFLTKYLSASLQKQLSSARVTVMNVRLNARKKALISYPGFANKKSVHVLMPHQYHGISIYSDLAFLKALPCLNSPLFIPVNILQLFL